MVGRPFQPGKSGNPGGKPKQVIEVVHLARQYTTLAITTLAEIAKEGLSEAARVHASEILIERGWGKAPQTITVLDERDTQDLTDQDLVDIVRASRSRVAPSSESQEAPNKLH